MSDPGADGQQEPATDAQRQEALRLLEGRRLAIDGSMWQAPTLTLVAQAFLLSVLTNRDVNWAVASAVAAAGAVALVVAMLALWLLHDRERHFAERVKDHANALHLGDPNRTSQRCEVHPLEWKGWVLWEIVLFAFLVADGVALVVTRTS